MDKKFLETPRHAVLVVGGACAGAEAAEIFAKAGILTVVVDQNPRPFGKIEDGLPRWHARQRRGEYKKIGEKLKTRGVMFWPCTRIGEHIDFETIHSWGFSAIVLACGAWNDRKVGVPGADEAVGKGLIYQNPFIYWFNHHEEESYSGEEYVLEDGALVIGGGLASIDVVKAVNLELAARELRKRNIECDVVEMEHKGLNKVLESHGLKWEDLGLEGCTLVYRRRNKDMPLAQFKDGADDASKEKTMALREKLMQAVVEKFFVKTQFNRLPKGIELENGKVSGLKVIKTRIEGRKVIELEGTEEVLPTTQILSSIGSVPDPIPGLPSKGEYYEYDDWDMGVVKDVKGVFGVGNVVTGQGNIQISRKHAKKVADAVLADYLGVGDGSSKELAPKAVEEAAAGTANAVVEHLNGVDRLEPAELKELVGKVKAWQHYVGYDWDFDTWIDKVMPPDAR